MNYRELNLGLGQKSELKREFSRETEYISPHRIQAQMQATLKGNNDKAEPALAQSDFQQSDASFLGEHSAFKLPRPPDDPGH